MTPREFYEITGPVQSRRIALVAGADVLIGESRDRYLLGVYADASMFVEPTTVSGVPFVGVNVTPQTPYVISQATHGGLTGEPHLLRPVVGGETVLVVEGFIYMPKRVNPDMEREIRARVIQELRGGDRRYIPTGTPAQPPKATPDHLSPNRRRSFG